MHGLRLLGIQFEVLPSLLQEFLTYGYVFPPNTLLRDVKQLFPGQRLSVTWDQTGNFEVTTDNPVDIFLKEFAGREPEKGVSTAIEDALIQTECSDNEIGVLLSGGLDSTLLFHYARNRWPNIQSYSVSYWFDEYHDMEKDYAETCASYLGANHRHFKPQSIEFFENVIWSIHTTGVPLLRMQTALLRSLITIIPKRCRALLCGQGADAVFGLSSQVTLLSGTQIDCFHPGPGCDFLLDELEVDLMAVQANRHEFMDDLNRAMVLVDAVACFDIAGGMVATQAEWSQVVAGQGRELVYPYLFHSLRAYTIGTDAYEKFLEPKYLLRRVARKIGIPEWIIARKKASFGPTCTDWEAQLLPLFSICRRTFDEAVVRSASKNHNARYVLWNMLTYSIWRELFVEEQDPEDLLRGIRSSEV